MTSSRRIALSGILIGVMLGVRNADGLEATSRGLFEDISDAVQGVFNKRPAPPSTSPPPPPEESGDSDSGYKPESFPPPSTSPSTSAPEYPLTPEQSGQGPPEGGDCCGCEDGVSNSQLPSTTVGPPSAPYPREAACGPCDGGTDFHDSKYDSEDTDWEAIFGPADKNKVETT